MPPKPNRLEKNASSELPCPVCLLPLSIEPSFRAHGPCSNQHQMEKKINNTGRYRPGKIVEINTVVSAVCGHLFHKLCFRHYCVGFKEKTSDLDGNIECPLCLEPISLTKVHAIDYKSCLSPPSAALDKIYRHTELMNKELNDQWNSMMITEQRFSTELTQLNTKLQSSKGKLAKLCQKLYKAESQISKMDEITDSIKHLDKLMNILNKENMLLVKMYLTEVRGMSEEFLKDKRIPKPLIPYLSIIMNDKRLLKRFGNILQHVEIDGSQSDTDILLKDILTKVRSDEITRKHDNPTANLLLQHLITKRKDIKVKGTRSSLVKVRRSSLVTTRLPKNGSAEESMQQIMKNVKEPIKTQRNAHEKIKPKIVEGSYRSSSEIQVLLEPKKKRQDVTDSKLERLLVLDGGDSEFIERNPFYLRRCKSRQPVLINYSRRQKRVGTKAKVFKKAKEDIKQDDVLKVAGNQEPVKQLTQVEVNEEKVQLSFRDYSLEPTDPSRSCMGKKGFSGDLDNKKKSENHMTGTDGYPTSTTKCIPLEEPTAVKSVVDILFQRKSKIDESPEVPVEVKVLMPNGNEIQCDCDSPPTTKDLLRTRPDLLSPSGLIRGKPIQLHNTNFGLYGTSSCLTRRTHRPVFIRPIGSQQMSSYPPRTFIPLVQRVQPSYIRRWLSKLPSQAPQYLPQGKWSTESYSFKSNESRSEANHIDHKRNAPCGDIVTSQINVTKDQSAPQLTLASSYISINIPESKERLCSEQCNASGSNGVKPHRSAEKMFKKEENKIKQ